MDFIENWFGAGRVPAVVKSFGLMAAFFAVIIMPQPAGAQVTAVGTSPVFPTASGPCSGQMLVNSIDVPFCIAETGGIDLDKVAVYASVPPIKDAWLNSWRPTQFDLTVVCVAKAYEQAFLRSAANQPASFQVKLGAVPSVEGRSCWVLQ